MMQAGHGGWRFPMVAFALLAAAVAGCGQGGKSNRERLEQYLAAHNSHDVTRSLSFFSQNAVVEIAGQRRLEGRSAIRNIEEWDAALNGEMHIDSLTVAGDTLVAGSVTERSDWFRLLGIPEVTYEPGTRFIFSQGRIVRVVPAPYSAGSEFEIARKLPPFVRWAAARHPDRLKAIMPDGKFLYTGQAAQTWLSLLREWRQTNPAPPEGGGAPAAPGSTGTGRSPEGAPPDTAGR